MAELSSNQRQSATITDSTASINFARSVLDILNSSNPINQAANNILKWLGRECIQEREFVDCVERCRSLAYPNASGLEIQKSISAGQNKVAMAGGLKLITSGALGRWLAFQPDHVYMVTTVAAVTRFHMPAFAEEVLCEMARAATDGSLEQERSHYAYSVDRARLAGVLSKVVESIYLNVVVAGHTFSKLPEELQSYCVHLVNAATYARIAIKISRSSSDLLLLCGRFQGDLLLWILTHFDGVVTVVIAGKELFRRTSQHSTQCLKMVVEKTCTGQDCRDINSRVELLELFSGSWRRIIDGQDDCSSVEMPSQRHSFYSTQLQNIGSSLNKTEILEVRDLARKLVLWILGRPVNPTDMTEKITFDVDLADRPGESTTRIADLFWCSPGILNSKECKAGELRPAVCKVPEVNLLEGSELLYEASWDPDSVLSDAFPELADLLDRIAERCNCRVCDEHGSIDQCRDGCLRKTAMSHLLMLIAHAIADGFGATDAAGIYSLGCNDTVRSILNQLIQGTLDWDYWFNAAASVVLGYFPAGVLARSHSEGTGALVAVQCGSLVVAARWLDLSRLCILKHCFALEVAEGRIAGAERSTAFVFSEVTMQLSCSLGVAVQCQLSPTDDISLRNMLDTDTSDPLVEHTIIGTSDTTVLRLVTFVTIGRSLRVIDPADVLKSAVRSISFSTGNKPCQQHRDRLVVRPPAVQHIVYVWSLENLLINWEIENDHTFITDLLDTDLKVNIAQGLSPRGCFMMSATSCTKCVLETLDNAPLGPFLQRVVYHEASRNTLALRTAPRNAM